MRIKWFLTRRLTLVVLALLLLLPNFFSFQMVPVKEAGYWWEQYDPELSNRLLTVDDVLKYTDSVTAVSGFTPKDLSYGVTLSRVIRKRFYHGYSHYTMNQNWVATVAGRFVWKDLSSPVLPDDILKYPMGACSQQSIVLMECFRRRNIKSRKVAFSGHFALEGMFDGKWYYFDTDLEPDFREVPRSSIDSIVQAAAIPHIYHFSHDTLQLGPILSSYSFSEPDMDPAPNAGMFHRVTKTISRLAWTIPLGILLLYPLKRKKNQKVVRAGGPEYSKVVPKEPAV